MALLPSKPGWYPNPLDRSSLRYWDGGRWTGRSRQRPPWVGQHADLDHPGESYDRSVEGPVHPRHLREPVTSGASWAQGPGLWRALQSYRTWNRPPAAPLEPQSQTAPPGGRRFGPARRPLAFFVALTIVSVAVVVSSFAIMAPYQRQDTPQFASQPAQGHFSTQADRFCTASLPKYRATLLTSFDGPSITAATRQMDALRLRLASLRPEATMQAPVEAWLAAWEQFTTLQRHYAALVGPAMVRAGKAVPRPIGPAAMAEARQAHRQALAEAVLADHYTANLRIEACMLEQALPA